MNPKKILGKCLIVVFIYMILGVISEGINQIVVNYTATYQMSNMIDSSLWIQILPRLCDIGAFLIVLALILVFRPEIKFIWNFILSRGEKENEKN